MHWPVRLDEQAQDRLAGRLRDCAASLAGGYREQCEDVLSGRGGERLLNQVRGFFDAYRVGLSQER